MTVTLMFLLSVVAGAVSAASQVEVDSCTFSGNGHIATLDGSRYDLHGSGVLSAISNDFLDFQIELVATDTANSSYVRGAAVSIRGDGLCRSLDCAARNTLTIAFGSALSSNPSAVADPVSFTFHDGNNTRPDLAVQLSAADLMIGAGLDDAARSALNRTGVVLQAADNATVTVVVRLDVQAPIVITIGPGYATLSTEALGGALDGDTGLCGLYSRTAMDDFAGAVLGAKADFYSDVRISAWAQQYIRSPTLFPNRPLEPRAPADLVTVPNRVEFWTSDDLFRALEACPGAIGNVSYRLCVRDFTLPAFGAVVARSNYDVVRAAQLDRALVASQSPQATTPTIVERRESAKSSTTVASAMSAGLGVACLFGMFANRRLRQQHSQELIAARANAIRLADNF